MGASMVNTVVQRTVTVNTEHGLHIRPCSLIAQAAQRFTSQIWVQREGARVDARQILQLLTLAAGPGTELQLEASGADANEAVEAVGQLFDSNFSEAFAPPKKG